MDINALIRKATREDAYALAELVNMAGEGMPLYLWQKMAAPGQSAWEVGRLRAARDQGGFSYRNATVCRIDGKVTSSLIGYPIECAADPSSYDDMPSMFVPLQQLEDLAVKSWYINVLATYPQYRGTGYASGLLSLAEEIAVQNGLNQLSLIVADANTAAIRLYEQHGYEHIDTRPMVKEQWQSPAENWLLLIKKR
jgi:ribosomal protein S18 acetylase RimI-like enzyme